jgi:Domain of unknown function (DUF4398)
LRVRRLIAACVALVCITACSEPPQKELDQAQGAVDTARAAGADQYAPDDYNAATASLQKAHEAVDQRDYRQALSYALDARERAKAAASAAADGQASARSDAEARITALLARTQQLDSRLTAAERARVPARELRSAHATLDDTRTRLQKAGTAVTGRNYKDAVTALDGVRENLDTAIAAVDAVMQHPPKPKRRR